MANDKTELRPVTTPLKTGVLDIPQIDTSKYIGKKAKLATVEEMKGEYGFCVRIATEILEKVGKVELRASQIFGLFEDSEGNLGWTPDSKLGVFLKKMGVKHYNELAGKTVIVQTTRGKDGRDYLAF